MSVLAQNAVNLVHLPGLDAEGSDARKEAHGHRKVSDHSVGAGIFLLIEAA